jgi:hypothetical protein
MPDRVSSLSEGLSSLFRRLTASKNNITVPFKMGAVSNCPYLSVIPRGLFAYAGRPSHNVAAEWTPSAPTAVSGALPGIVAGGYPRRWQRFSLPPCRVVSEPLCLVSPERTRYYLSPDQSHSSGRPTMRDPNAHASEPRGGLPGAVAECTSPQNSGSGRARRSSRNCAWA